MTALTWDLTYSDISPPPVDPGVAVGTLTRRRLRPAASSARETAGVVLSGAGGRNPQWLEPVASHIIDLMELPPNWDSYGGVPATRLAAQTTVRALYALLRDEAQAPSVVPTSRGGIQLEWHNGTRDLEIEIEPNGRTTVYYASEADAIEHEGEFREILVPGSALHTAARLLLDGE